ncbi:ferredoxin family protein [Victivallis sp. Marseille-Q1083]|uniref:4Fe-4S dicluster domain-containing protein n=1 Tax=Victivallis sp. Marseille-Q1083 TaxID=2717288 RepID=UPI0015891555|nr:ferredoxin family protein [Victivallis sp. Marseille-Q1083]
MSGSKRLFRVRVNPDECKGCERCVNACPRSVLKMGTQLNKMSFPYAIAAANGCIGCGGCFYTCPEPGAIAIFELINDEKN